MRPLTGPSPLLRFCFQLGGLAVLGVGAWTISDHLAYSPLLSTVTYSLCAWVLALSGMLVVATAVLGCVGVWRRNRCLLLGVSTRLQVRRRGRGRGATPIFQGCSPLCSGAF